MLFTLVALACIDSAVTPIATPELGPDLADTGEPNDTGEAEPACPAFTFGWTAPIAGELHIQGELQDSSGAPLDGWKTLTGTVTGTEVSVTLDACSAAAFRGEGVADVDGDGEADMWSCTLQADGSFALTGEVRFDLDGEPLPAQAVPDPTSPGCGVYAAFPQE